MKHFSLIFSLALFLQEGVFAQGLGPFDHNWRYINFVAVSNAPLGNLPSGTVGFYTLIYDPDAGYSTNVLNVDIDVGSAPNTSGWIVQMGNDGSLTPILPLTIGPHYTGLGSPPAWYADYASVQLTDDQLQNFFAGQLYAETDFGSDSYLGQLLPVPEPSGMALIFIGGGLFALIRNLNKRKFLS